MSAHYQVTLEWGAAAMRVATADVVVLADADRGPETAELRELAPRTSVLLEATLESAAAVARAALDEQERRGDRVSIAIVAAGERWADAGRVVDELAALGIDFHSPACAAACAASVALRGATKTLIAAEAAAARAAEPAPAGASAPDARPASATQTGAAR